ncbi:MAG TPA: ATPase domain-containing protein [Candidatus Binataceae bacterium]
MLEFAEILQGRELTRKDCRLTSGIAPLDHLLNGGIVRGRISEIIGRTGSGRTSLAASFAASATSRGEIIAWVEQSPSFDPESLASAGLDLRRVLWASIRESNSASGFDSRQPHARRLDSPQRHAPLAVLLKSAELILEAGGFGLIVIDFGNSRFPVTQSAALRLARAAERSGAAVIAISSRRMCGTFAALSLSLRCVKPCFSRIAPRSSAIFDGLKLEATVARNKLGASGRSTILRAIIDGVAFAPEKMSEPPVLAYPDKFQSVKNS